MKDHPAYVTLLAIMKGDEDAAARWVRSVRSMMSKTFDQVCHAAGGYDKMREWIERVDVPVVPQRIERLHVKVVDPKTGKLKATTISLDPELYGALVARHGTGDAASKWVKSMALSLTADHLGNRSVSRTIQGEIARHLSTPRSEQDAAEPPATPADEPPSAVPDAHVVSCEVATNTEVVPGAP